MDFFGNDREKISRCARNDRRESVGITGGGMGKDDGKENGKENRKCGHSVNSPCPHSEYKKKLHYFAVA